MLFRSATSVSIDPSVRQALSHPMIWYAMGRLGDDHATALLNGEPKALDALSHHVIAWFIDKVTKRRHIEPEEIMEILLKVASRTELVSRVELSFAIWRECACQVVSIDTVGKHLYDEALSAGIIEQTGADRQWSWRHPFVARYLAGVAGKEG